MWDLLSYRDNTAIITENGEKYTYVQLDSMCEEFFSHIGERCLIINFCTNTLGSVVGYVSAVNNKAVPIMVDADLNYELQLSLVESYKPKYLWLPSDMTDRFKGTIVYSEYSYSLLKTEYTHAYKLFDELALLLTTSGSTGSPKLVRQSYDNIKANTESIVEYLKLDETERPITTLPMNYTYGISIINTHLYVGASIILTKKTLMQKEFWTQFKEYGATSFGGVPYTYEILNKLRFFRMQLPTLRTMTQAGGKISTELHKKFAEFAQETGRNFVVMYGQTEATARMAYLPPNMAIEKCGSMGVAIPGGKFKLIDVDGNEITTPEVTGELVYEGKNVTLGYAQSGVDLEKGDENNGVLITGDMAKFDVDGYYYIVGRKKRFLKIFGSRVNLDETERIIRSEFKDIDCACGGVDDKMSIFVTDKSQEDNVVKFLSEKLGFHFSAFKTVIVDTIPRNESGKIMYTVLNEMDR